MGKISEFKEYIKGEVSSQGDKLVQGISNIFSNFDKINEDIAHLSAQL